MLLTSMLLLGGVCLVDLQATESESMGFLYSGPGAGGLVQVHHCGADHGLLRWRLGQGQGLRHAVARRGLQVPEFTS